jgi:hypothetical protein
MDEREWARKEVKNDLKLRKYHMSFWTQLYIIHTLANPGFLLIFKDSKIKFLEKRSLHRQNGQ